MKVRELIEKLQKFDGELEVMTSIDDEGNGYNPCYGPYGEVMHYDGEYMYRAEELEEEGLDPADLQGPYVVL